MIAHVEFCGEVHLVETGSALTVGREGGLVVDDNPYLHRRFLQISAEPDLVWLANIGSRLTATVSDEDGLVQSWLGPGARIPLVFPRTTVLFTAGPTTYDLEVVIADASFRRVVTEEVLDGEVTVGRLTLTPDQKLLVLSLVEPVLRRGDRGPGNIPSNTEAAARLGWTITKYNRKLDNVCDKLTRAGVRGLHGDASRLATSRRARLVEYALAARLVHSHELALLDERIRVADGAAT